MHKAPDSIAQILLRIGDRVTQLVGKHFQLMRLEVEDEARLLARKLGRQAKAVGITAPLIIAGVVLVAGGISILVALLLRPLLGSWSFPISFIALGVLLAYASLRWLVKTLQELEQAQDSRHQAQEERLSAGENGALSKAEAMGSTALASQAKSAKAPPQQHADPLQHPGARQGEPRPSGSSGPRVQGGRREAEEERQGDGLEAANSRAGKSGQKADLRSTEIPLHMNSPPRPEIAARTELDARPEIDARQGEQAPVSELESPADRRGKIEQAQPPV